MNKQEFEQMVEDHSQILKFTFEGTRGFFTPMRVLVAKPPAGKLRILPMQASCEFRSPEDERAFLLAGVKIASQVPDLIGVVFCSKGWQTAVNDAELPKGMSAGDFFEKMYGDIPPEARPDTTPVLTLAITGKAGFRALRVWELKETPDGFLTMGKQMMNVIGQNPEMKVEPGTEVFRSLIDKTPPPEELGSMLLEISDMLGEKVREV